MTLPRKVYRWGMKLSDWAAKDSVREYLRQHANPGRVANLPPVIIVTLPKSGTIYLLRTLRKTLRVPRIRFGSYSFTEPIVWGKTFERMKAGACVAHEHLPPADHIVAALALAAPAINVHIRDPRRALISWMGHLHDLIDEGRQVDALAFAEYTLPEGYGAWSVEQQLEWHIDHVLPRMVAWIEGWLRVADDPNQRLKIVLTTLEEMQRDPMATVQKILRGLNVPFEDSWIVLPEVSVGENNVRRDPKMDRKTLYSPALWDRATAMVPQLLRERFGWK